MSDTATAIVQARMGSTRLPGKSMEPVGGVPVVELVLRRLAKATRLSKVVLATSDLPRDTVLAEHAESLGIPVFRGSESDLVARYVGAAAAYANGPYLVRATADNVFMDWAEIDRLVAFGIEGNWDFVGFTNPIHTRRINDFAGEFLRRDALEKVADLTTNPHDREHVFPYFYAHPELFRVTRIDVGSRLHTPIKLDLDDAEDLARLRSVGDELKDPIEATAEEVVRIANRLH